MIEHLNLVLDLIVITFAVMLSFISWIAYKKSHLKSVLFLLLAFAFFIVKKALENIPALLPTLQKDYIEVGVTLIEVVILGLFFVAIAKKGD